MVNFRTIRQTAALGLITEYQLRLMVKQNRCPGIMSGTRFLVNVDALSEMLDSESRKCMEAQHD